MVVVNRGGSTQETSAESKRPRSGMISPHTRPDMSSRFTRSYSKCCSRRCPKPLRISQGTRTRCKTLIRSYGWKTLMILFYTFVLFGHPLYLLLSFKEAVYDSLAILAFMFCLLEVVLRTIAEPHYIHLELPSFGSSRLMISGNDSTKSCPVGSFLFWCDLVSTGAILYHVSWVNMDSVRLKTVEIVLDRYGFPVSVLLRIF